MVSNASSCPKIWRNGKPTKSSRALLKTLKLYFPSSPFWKKMQSRIDIGRHLTKKQLTEFLTISLKYSSSKIWLKQRCWIWSKISKKSVSQPKNKRKLKFLLVKSMSSGLLNNSSSDLGEREKTSFWVVSAFNKLQKDSKKIRWSWVQLTPKDTSFLSRSKSNN